MKNKIENLLRKSPQLKAREIANEIDIPKKQINYFLHKNKDHFVQDAEYRWSLMQSSDHDNSKVLNIELPAGWVDRDLFEKALKKSGCPLSSSCQSIVFIVPKGCLIMLEASARILALCNQLAEIGKNVTIDFSNSRYTLRYLNRSGFLDQLNRDIIILPERPRNSRSKQYSGNSKNLFEIQEIDPTNPNEDIPENLTNIFTQHAGEQYYIAAFTIFTELLGNVCEHSATPISGFAGLQTYGGSKPHIQTIVSDSGVGILATVQPFLRQRYPEVAESFDPSDPKSGLRLIKRMLIKGGITSRQKSIADGGQGLQSTHGQAKKFDAKISVRQETTELILTYADGTPKKSRLIVDMPRIKGTQVCFDFMLANKLKSR